MSTCRQGATTKVCRPGTVACMPLSHIRMHGLIATMDLELAPDAITRDPSALSWEHRSVASVELSTLRAPRTMAATRW